MVVKSCTDCKITKSINLYNKDSYQTSGYKSYCKMCSAIRVNNWRALNRERVREYDRIYQKSSDGWAKRYPEKHKEKVSRRRSAELKRIPSWANLTLIKEVYRNCPKGYEVDHIIPLQGKNVSGLHVHTNLQYLTIADNRSKGNKF